ncbi:MAG: chorismate-binding protein, partial [Planctomycetota bacterium]
MGPIKAVGRIKLRNSGESCEENRTDPNNLPGTGDCAGPFTFTSLSPECLYQKAGNRIFSEALAGTNFRDVDQELNRQLQGELLESQKEAEEHEYVFENIKSELENICEEVTIVNKREILSLEYVQHLRSRFKGTLKKGIGDRDILCALHPTAAVNGFPKKAALALIRKHEHFSRGW